MKLENEFLLVEIAAQGAEVTRIFNKKDETDVQVYLIVWRKAKIQ